jgi:four helix bundle protein
MIKSYRDLKVYQLSYSFAMDIFWKTKNFPREELYSLTDQIRRSSRSISSNIVEGWAKRKYENVFKRQLIDSFGSSNETQNWLNFAHDCKYLEDEEYEKYSCICDEIGKMLIKPKNNWTMFD